MNYHINYFFEQNVLKRKIQCVKYYCYLIHNNIQYERKSLQWRGKWWDIYFESNNSWFRYTCIEWSCLMSENIVCQSIYTYVHVAISKRKTYKKYLTLVKLYHIQLYNTSCYYIKYIIIYKDYDVRKYIRTTIGVTKSHWAHWDGNTFEPFVETLT